MTDVHHVSYIHTFSKYTLMSPSRFVKKYKRMEEDKLNLVASASFPQDTASMSDISNPVFEEPTINVEKE